MATGKRFYWMKLKESFLNSDAVDFLMSQPNGSQYVVLYQMLCLKTINTGGRLLRQIGEIIIPYDTAKIKRDCKYFSEDTINVALRLYASLGLVYQDDDGTLVMTDHDSLVGSETDYAEKNRRIRANHQARLSSGADNDVHNVSSEVSSSVPADVSQNVSENVPIDIRDKRLENRDIDRDIDRDIKKEKEVKEKEVPHSAKKPSENDFNRFWEAYPRKDSKKDARKAFGKAFQNNKDLTVDDLIIALDVQKQSRQWQEDGGRFIPLASTWLNGERWENEGVTKPPGNSNTENQTPKKRECNLSELVEYPIGSGQYMPPWEYEKLIAAEGKYG